MLLQLSHTKPGIFQSGRKRYFEIAGGAVIEIDTASAVAFDLKNCSRGEPGKPRELTINTFKQQTGLIRTHD